jgi:polysaccharide biosynthesis/export protein
VNLLLWGRMNMSAPLTVQRDGSVLVPEVGPMQIAGLTFGQAKTLLETRLDQITGVHAQLTMGQLRTIQVFVVGQVAHPGVYAVPALSHMSNALAAAGGVNKVGSLRLIQLKRNNQLIDVLDLYQILQHGNTTRDVILQEGDVIFVPLIGPVVAVAGDVKMPGIYELLSDASLSGVLRLAGGVTAFGYSGRLQVERVADHEKRLVLDVDLSQVGSGRFQLRDGDLVEIFPVLPRQHNAVTLIGNVNRPGIYEWIPGMRVADLIRSAEGVADHTYFGYAMIKRIQGPSEAAHYLPINLTNALNDPVDAAADPELKPRDEVTIFNQADLADLPEVTVQGAVRRAGSFELTQGMRVSDLIYAAGGLREEAYLPRAELARTEVVGAGTRYTFIDIDLNNALHGGGNDILLRRSDELFVQVASNYHKPWQR